MFTGIVKSLGLVRKVTEHKGEYKIQVKAQLSGLKAGDSVAVDGVCLTLEKISDKVMHFHLGIETLKVTGWDVSQLSGKKVNLEPALRVGDFIGGHFVTGHADGTAEILCCKKQGESVLMELKIPDEFKAFFYKKGFITLNGVSLTVNAVKGRVLKLCLVPETLKRSNLSDQKKGALLTFEADYLTRALLQKKL